MRHDLSTIPPGTAFGGLTVVRLLDERRHGKRVYLCQCECGEFSKCFAPVLRRGDARSCGCRWRKRITGGNPKHGLHGHPLYSTWKNLRARCNNPNDASYHRYGGRGITVDPRWDDFARFAADMGDRPSPDSEIDRINNDGPYSPENCQWLTRAKHSAKHQPRRLCEVDGCGGPHCAKGVCSLHYQRRHRASKTSSSSDSLMA